MYAEAPAAVAVFLITSHRTTSTGMIHCLAVVVVVVAGVVSSPRRVWTF